MTTKALADKQLHTRKKSSTIEKPKLVNYLKFEQLPIFSYDEATVLTSTRSLTYDADDS